MQYGRGSGHDSSQNTNYIINTIAVDDQVTQGARVSSAML